MATLLAHIQVFSGKEADFENVMKEMYRITHATEPNCLRYEYWRGEKEGFYYCLLSYKTNQDFWEHQASDHHEGYMQDFVACIEDLRLESLDPVANASPLMPAAEQAVSASVSAAVKKQALAFPIGVKGWWKAFH
ncbi:putative quinol monooxygenase [Oceanicoccus sp. KOV_DT_Chl]|uniref:putative quinol monooxygenase n=1 Tax=Oceanicoccus sp. KOV_DT_Chl TaxID=1904639 RepID=UPI000C79C595|nr:antibiotic biosynthesis monooxygenase family protein [Oceanicoccus sp. KOV_DT_Chl]